MKPASNLALAAIAMYGGAYVIHVVPSSAWWAFPTLALAYLGLCLGIAATVIGLAMAVRDHFKGGDSKNHTTHL